MSLPCALTRFIRGFSPQLDYHPISNYKPSEQGREASTHLAILRKHNHVQTPSPLLTSDYSIQGHMVDLRSMARFLFEDATHVSPFDNIDERDDEASEELEDLE